MMYESDMDLIYLQKELEEHFDLEELKALCWELKIDYENLSGDTRTAKTRELVKFGYRNGRIGDIIELCQKKLPKVVWNQPGKIYRQDELPEEWVEPLQRLFRLVREFNRNRHRPFSDDRTKEGDEIAFTMREAAPFLFGQFDVKDWLDSGNPGKRLAAIKYLEWLQDIEYLNSLLGKLIKEKPFMQLHSLVAIDSMLDQLNQQHQKLVHAALIAYKIVARDPSLEFWRDRILRKLKATENDAS